MSNVFDELDIKPKSNGMVGNKISIHKILNCEITVCKYLVQPSKFDAAGKCLYMQIEYKDEKRVVFTGSGVLLDMLERVPKDKFPFKATIIKEDGRFEFQTKAKPNN